jgi:hypothetical protein
MILDRDGFTINRYTWYPPLRVPGARSANFAPDHRAMQSATYRNRQVGQQRIFPDTYGLGAEGLVQLMSQWRQRAPKK